LKNRYKNTSSNRNSYINGSQGMGRDQSIISMGILNEMSKSRIMSSIEEDMKLNQTERFSKELK